jgi:flagellar motor protein MotB
LEIGKPATVEVVSSGPAITRVAAEESRAGTDRWEKLEKEIKERDKRIEELKNEVEKAKSTQSLDPQKIESMKKREQLELLYGALRQNLKNEMERGEIRITNGDGKKISVIIPGLFVSDEADPDKKKLAILEKTGQVLEKDALSKKIEIKGYADALLGKDAKRKFPSAWHLSAARASAVAKILQWKIGINGKYLTVVGRASHQSPDDKTVGTEKNRKMEIVVSLE